MNSRLIGLVCLTLGLMLVTGCGKEERVGVRKTTGKVIRTGAPVTGLSVIFPRPTGRSRPRRRFPPASSKPTEPSR
uniref:hypothetical protein n=1 Tax=Zavarzinella formosa TaxID=360055 RepID=UPI0036F44D18